MLEYEVKAKNRVFTENTWKRTSQSAVTYSAPGPRHPGAPTAVCQDCQVPLRSKACAALPTMRDSLRALLGSHACTIESCAQITLHGMCCAIFCAKHQNVIEKFQSYGFEAHEILFKTIPRSSKEEVFILHKFSSQVLP